MVSSPGPALHADAVRLVKAWAAPTPRTELIQEQFLALLSDEPGVVRRDHPGAHVTASILVVHPDLDQVLLCLHGRVGKWLQLGGHLEDEDRDILGAARREAHEESGLDDLDIYPVPVDLDIHPVPCRYGPAMHFDIRFVGVAGAGAVPRVSDESRDLRWFPVGALPEPLGSDTDRLISAALQQTRR